MEIRRMITTIDAHCGGEPLRIVTAGLPPLAGATMLERRRYLREHLDDVRRLLMFEPRGHPDMYGCVLTPPVSAGADLGVLFMHNEGYSTMCGHGVIALVTALLETGVLPVREPETAVALDTPAGPVSARAEVAGGRVRRVTFANVPSFVYARDVRVELPGLGPVRADVAFGGAFYAVVEAATLDLAVRPVQVKRLTEAGARIAERVAAELPIRHPRADDLGFLYGTILWDRPERGPADARNVTVFADAQVDRSPCGTGTSAVMALRHAEGRLKLGEPFVHESIVGTRFGGRLVASARVGPYEAVIPEITGSAHLTGFHQFVVDPEDPLAEGFVLR